MNQIHNTAIIGKNVKLGSDVSVGPYSVIEGNIEIGDQSVIGPHVYITGMVKIGKSCKITAGAIIGEAPQDYSFDGIPGLVEIGDGCMIREGATVHSPIHGNEGGKTVLGNNVFMMVNSHVGHNTIVGDNCILVNGCVLAGFVVLEENVNLSGNTAVHQFCRIGAFSMVGGLSKAVQDVPPYTMTNGNPAVYHGLNVVGLRRNGFNQEQRTAIKDAYKTIYGGMLRKDALEVLKEKYPGNPQVQHIIEFVQSSKRGLISGHGE